MADANLCRPKTGHDHRHDFLASIVVFLVALPLCMGIAIACNAPPAMGLFAGIIGGIVVGAISGSPLQVTGPAAGLTVLVYDLVQHHGLAVLGVVVFAAGAMQLAAGLFRLGRWFRAVSPAVIHGMMAGIGILIIASQMHVMLDSQPKGSGLPNLVALVPTFYEAVTCADGPEELYAAALGLGTIAIVVLWKRLGLEKLVHMPGHLPAIVITTIVSVSLALPVKHVVVPDNLAAAIQLPTVTTFTRLLDSQILLTAVSLALIASAETLLSAGAVDQLHHGPRTNYDKELRGQGIGNMLCGLVGALPVTGVIARSTVNIGAGGRTRRSTIYHGIWLLAAVVALPFVLNMIPIASLAGLLVYTGCKLVDVKIFKEFKNYGKAAGWIYLATVSIIVCTDLLTGVFVGMCLALGHLVLTVSRVQIELVLADAVSNRYVLKLNGKATFLMLPVLADQIERVPPDAELTVDFERLSYIDHACLAQLESFAKRHTTGGGKLNIDWDRLKQRFELPPTSTPGPLAE